jgi:hypothetical protein
LIGGGFDSTSTFTNTFGQHTNPVAAVARTTFSVSFNGAPALGSHFVAALEQGDTVNNNTYNYNSNNALSLSLRM